MAHYRLALLGFGNVGRNLVKLLGEKRAELQERYGITFTVTGVASRRLGWLVNDSGFSLDAVLADPQSAADQTLDTLDAWLTAARPTVLFENSSMNPHTGQPALDYCRAALNRGIHVVTANKGPVVHGYHELRGLAESRDVRFLFEAAVMGGAPIFSLFREALPACNLKRFRGILNSTTNLILTEMEHGQSYEAAVKKAQAMGIAETDPSFDVDGWDAAVKVAAIATVLMDVPVKPADVKPVGITALTQEQVQAARAAGRPFKLVCQAEKDASGQVTVSVSPQQLETSDPLANVNGSDSLAIFETDTLYRLNVSEGGADAYTTAYGPLADFITISKP